MRLSRSFELADWGGPKPTWREIALTIRRGKPRTLATSLRRITNRKAKREILRHGQIGLY